MKERRGLGVLCCVCARPDLHEGMVACCAMDCSTRLQLRRDKLMERDGVYWIIGSKLSGERGRKGEREGERACVFGYVAVSNLFFSFILLSLLGCTLSLSTARR